MNVPSLREAATLALEAMEAMQSYAAAERKGLRICDESITALKAALAAPEKLPMVEIETVLTVQGEPACCCGEPTAAGVVHRRDGPCYMAEPEQDGKCQHCTDGCPACDARKLADQLLEDQIVYGTAILQGGKRVDPKSIFKAEPITDAMMNLVDRLGSEADQVDPRAWHHLLVYAPKQKPVQEPVAWQWLDTGNFRKAMPEKAMPSDWRPLYAAPPQRKPLMQEEIAEMFEEVVCALPPYPSVTEEMPERFTRAIERAHGIGGEP